MGIPFRFCCRKQSCRIFDVPLGVFYCFVTGGFHHLNVRCTTGRSETVSICMELLLSIMKDRIAHIPRFSHCMSTPFGLVNL